MFESIKKLLKKPQPVQDVNYDKCSVCGFYGKFYKNNPSFREGYQCPECRSSLRYRGQASSILKIYGNSTHKTIADLSQDQEFAKLKIFEPGVIGPFRKYFSSFDYYKNSFYWEDIPLGKFKDGIQCQSLEDLTFDDNEIDLIISSDIMEHVRHPSVAFTDIYRVLKPGGYHIFTIPLHLPMREKSKARVDTSSDEDIYLDEPHYHGDGVGGKSLVYTDFGADIEQQLKNIGYSVSLDTLDHEHTEVKKIVTLVTQKPIV